MLGSDVKSSCSTFTAKLALAQLTQAPPRHTTGWSRAWARSSARPVTGYARSTLSRPAKRIGGDVEERDKYIALV